MTTDRFCKNKRTLEATNAAYVNRIKELAEELQSIIDQYPNRESSVASTELETAIMWAVKGIVRADAAAHQDTVG